MGNQPSLHPPELKLCRALQMAQTPCLLSYFCTPGALPASCKPYRQRETPEKVLLDSPLSQKERVTPSSVLVFSYK